jgi:hypothetical protein
LIARIFGVHMVRIPWGEIAHITGHITLKKPGATYGLLKTEHRFAPIGCPTHDQGIGAYGKAGPDGERGEARPRPRDPRGW